MAPVAQNSEIPPDLTEPERFAELKSKLIKPENVERVKASWKRLLVALNDMAEDIKRQGDSIIPSIDWSVVKAANGEYPPEIAKVFKERGILIVRNVVDRDVCLKWKDSMANFVGKHPEIGGYPTPITNWFAFWTEGEVNARSHPEVVALMKSMGQFFTIDDDSLPIDKESHVVYPDAFRIRPPGFGVSLDLHLDAGAIERWEDEVYREVYAPILEGRWEDFDPWRLDERAFAKTDLYSHLSTRPTATSAFRALQGWLALSDVKAGEGTIRVLPNIKLVNAYSILRPFFWADTEEIDLTSAKFPGVTFVGTGQFFLNKYMHHLRQAETVLSIPYANVGDYVFWHADVAHEVDKQHNGSEDSSVFFNAYCPLSPYNVENLLATHQAFLDGKAPRDFIKDKALGKQCEGDFEDNGAKKENILTDDGLKAMGFMEFDENQPGITKGQRIVRKMANEAIKSGKLR